MRKLIIAAASAAALATASAAGAQSISFGSPTGPLGTSQSYTDGTYTVVATGYSAPLVQATLYGKSEGAGETGLGLYQTPDNEIPGPGSSFIQLDVSELVAALSGASFTMNSVTDGEGWAVYGSNLAGDGGTLLSFILSGSDENSHPFGSWGTYQYYDFYSTGTNNLSFGNVLLSSVAYAVPEPATWAMMLIGFGAIGLTMRRRRKPVLAQLA